MTGIFNWSENHAFRAAEVLRPQSVDAVRRAVAASLHIHAAGARHSFNDSADGPGAMIDLGDIAAEFVIDADRATVTAGAACSYGTLALRLEAAGWALANMASLPHITLAGAISTGTHGSGDTVGTLSSAVAGLDLVTATGDLVRLRRGDAEFDGMVVALGALGVVVRVMLDIVPSYRLRQDAFQGLVWPESAAEFDRVMGAGKSVSLFTTWSGTMVDRWWIKTPIADGAPDVAPVVGAEPARFPFLGPPADRLRRLTTFGVAGPWCDRLPHGRIEFEQTRHLQSEILVPRARVIAAIGLLRAMGGRIDRHLLVTEIRSMAADGLWLSPAQGRDTVGIHFSWSETDPAAVGALCQEIEGLLIPLGGRPHWGKILHAAADQLASLYPRMADFRRLVARYDAGGKFRNGFLDRHVIGYTKRPND